MPTIFSNFLLATDAEKYVLTEEGAISLVVMVIAFGIAYYLDSRD